VPALLDALDKGQVVTADEIGSMEILSPRFRDAILRILDGDALTGGDTLYTASRTLKSYERPNYLSTRGNTAAQRREIVQLTTTPSVVTVTATPPGLRKGVSTLCFLRVVRNSR
jgi:hypothetical protein